MRPKKVAAIATAIFFLCVQSLPAVAYGPAEANARLNDVRAMFNLRVPLGASQGGTDYPPSLGFTVQRQYQFSDPVYEIATASRWGSLPLTVKAMDLRFGMQGRHSTFEIARFNAIGLKANLDAETDDDEGVPNWLYILGGVVAVGLVLGLVSGNKECAEGEKRYFFGCGDPAIWDSTSAQ